jgi:hypothetical protein
MAISSKGKRKITVDKKEYFWWVHIADEDDFIGASVLTVISEKKGLHVRYGVQQVSAERFVVALGPYFKGIAGVGGCWRRFICPKFGSGDAVTPKDVAALILWSHETQGESVEVDYLARVVGVVPNGVSTMRLLEADSPQRKTQTVAIRPVASRLGKLR